MAFALIGEPRRGPAPARRRRLASALLATAAVLALAGAAAPAAAQTGGGAIDDPMEGVNRQFYKLHQGIDRVLLRPAAFAYQRIFPKVVAQGAAQFPRQHRRAADLRQ
ncbi:MAG: MlaA family lipoprotein [Caulobacteraceae bacterium]